MLPEDGDTTREGDDSMALSGTTNEQKIWNYLKNQGFNDFGIAGLMGNLYAESGLIPTNLQNTYEKSLGYTDASYTAAVDDGSYNNFVKDSAGYGLAQWTYWSRKQGLLNHAKSAGKSVGDLEIQLEYLLKELTSYGLINDLKTATSVLTASNLILLQFEKPATKDSAETQSKRAGYGQAYYDKYADTTLKGGATMSNSSLVSYTNITKNKTSPRNHAIDTITIHCIVGQWTAKQGCDYFASTSRQASANYIVGKDGSIGLSVAEADRSWCSSNAANDHRAVTIEVASDTTDPYAVTDAAYNALIKLVADICKRNGIAKLVWSTDKNTRVNHLNGANMTCHRDYAAKACPGEYLYSREGDIASKVNAILNGQAESSAGSTSFTITTVTAYQVRITVKNLNIRSGPGTGYSSKGYITPGVYTIIAESSGTGASKWGKLKSGEGWVSLDYCEKISSSTTATQSVSELDAAVDKLAKLGVINSPDYWKKTASGDTLKYLDQLFIKSAAKITAAGTRFTNVTLAINQLVKDGIINSPDYWTEHYKDCSSVDSLLCALAGAKKS